MRRDQAVVDIARMAGRIAQACESRNIGQTMQQPAERPARAIRPLAMIGIDVLSDERDFAHAMVDEPLHVVHDLLDRARDLGAAGVGHDAKGAELVAAFLHRHEGGNAARADHRRRRLRQIRKLVFGRKFGLDRPAFAFRLLKQLRQMMVALRADHDVDGRRAANDLIAFGLGDASRYRDAHGPAVACGFVLGETQPPQFRIDLLGSLFADVAGVEDH